MKNVEKKSTHTQEWREERERVSYTGILGWKYRFFWGRGEMKIITMALMLFMERLISFASKRYINIAYRRERRNYGT